MMDAKLYSKRDIMHNNDANYVLKTLNNNEFVCAKCKLSTSKKHSKACPSLGNGP